MQTIINLILLSRNELSVINILLIFIFNTMQIGKVNFPIFQFFHFPVFLNKDIDGESRFIVLKLFLLTDTD